MKISQLPLSRNTRVETTTDAHVLLTNEACRDSYITRWGNVDVIEDTDDYGRTIYRVPAFAQRIKEFTEAKAADCRIWGCE